MSRRTPKLCHHKGRELGYITVAGKEVYFTGRWLRKRKTAPSAIQDQYAKAIAALVVTRGGQIIPAGLDPTISELWQLYEEYTKGYYVKNGKQTSEVGSIKDACRIVARTFGSVRAREFGPRSLRAVRDEFIRMAWSRDHVNKQVSRVRRMFRWAVSEELIPESVWSALQSVPDVRAGQGLREARVIRAVPDEVVEATLPHCPKTLQNLIRAHRLIGCRGDEACAMRASEIDTAAAPGLWKFTPTSSKNQASYWVGPKAQEVLRPLLDQARPTAWLFPTRGRGRGCWSTASYRRAVERAIRLASAARPADSQLPRWGPLNIRHAAGQEARDTHVRGIEATQARLQHKEISASQKYAWELDKLAQDVARAMG